MLGVCLFYVGLVTTILGAVSLLRPLAILGVGTRLRGVLVLGAGFAVAAIGLSLPVKAIRIETIQTHLDEFAPVYQFYEVHTIRVAASRERTYRALKGVTADEIMFFRTLTWIRRFGQPGPESILNAPERLPLLEVATRTSFLLLAEDPGREIVVGTLVAAPAGTRLKAHPTSEDFKALERSGFAKAAMNFRIEDTDPNACLVTTETRVYATDATTQHRFAAYWRVIYPGSALIRRMWLRAVKLRAEAAGS